MAYTFGDIILDDHFNIFVTGNAAGTGDNSVANLNTVWGTGNSDKGYGQTGTVLSAVSAGATITATEWATMLTRMQTIADHQGSSITPIAGPTVGNTISAFTALDSNITTTFNNRLNNVANGTDATNTQDGTGSWTVSTTHTLTVTFGSVNQTRYFFNAGGEIRFSFARSGGTAHTKNTEWTDLCNDSGTIIFGARSTTATGQSGANNILLTSTGYYDITTGDTIIWKKFQDTSPYTANFIQIEAKTDGAGGANNGNGTILTFTVTYADAATPDDFDDTVDGTITTTLVERPPSTTFITQTWGNPGFGGVNVQT